MNQTVQRKNSKQIEGDLRTRLKNREWQVGEKIASCRELAEQYQCSVNTIGKALRNLEMSGFVVREPRRGVIVSGDVETHQKTGLIAAFVPQIDNPLWTSALRGIEDYMHQYNYSMISGSHDLSSARLRQTLDNLQSIPIDGMILSPLNQTAEERQWFRHLIESKLEQNIKIVLLDRFLYELNVPYVTSDNINASYKLTRVLLENGHRSIAFVSGNTHISTIEERYAGFSQACYDAGLKEGNFFRFGMDLQQEDFRNQFDAFEQQLMAYLKAHPVTALFAANDQFAKASWIALKNAGLRIPEDISLVSYDVDNLRKEVPIRIAGVRQNFYEMGTMAANILLNHIFISRPQEDMQLGTIVPADILKDYLLKVKPENEWWW